MLAQIKDNLLFTLKDIQFSIPEKEADRLLYLMDENGGFVDLPYDEEDPNAWSWTGHMARLAYLATNEKITGHPEKKEAILRGLDFFGAEHRKNPNWWHNDIGLPRNCGRFALCMEEFLSPRQKELLLGYVKQGSIALRPNVLNLWYGANLLWGVTTTIYHAVLEGDPSLMESALEAAAKDLCIKNGGEGIQPDYSFFQHQTQFYNGGYGRSFIAEIANIIYTLKGTDYQLPAEKLSVLGFYIIYGARYCIRNNHYDYLTSGREIARPKGLSAQAVRDALYLLLKVEEMPCRDVMQEQFASFGAEGYSLKGNKFFNESNYYTSRSTTYHIGCRGTSPLRSMGETINGENHLSANLYAGGATCIMIDGKEYDDIFPLWDFARVPGTTAPAENDQEIAQKIALWHGKNADNTYCHGVSHNNYGVMYQDLNFNGVKGVISRFFVDDIMIALGAGLTCDSQKELVTTLNQCRQYSDILTEKDGLPHGAVYQGRVAYLSLDEQVITAESEERFGKFARINVLNRQEASGKICTFTISHGVDPKNASYAYAVIPAVSANTAGERIENVAEKVTVLRNDEKVQAIRYKDKVFCVFHQKDTFYLSMYDKLIGSAPSAFIL